MTRIESWNSIIEKVRIGPRITFFLIGKRGVRHGEIADNLLLFLAKGAEILVSAPAAPNFDVFRGFAFISRIVHQSLVSFFRDVHPLARIKPLRWLKEFPTFPTGIWISQPL